MSPDIFKIDATGKILGKLATEVAFALRGKNNPNFVPNEEKGPYVVVKNAKGLVFTGKKLKQKKYYSHSGYLGGLKEITLEKLFSKDPEDVVRRAVYGMLPKNRMRAKLIKKLRFE